jgi:hypothetical protein
MKDCYSSGQNPQDPSQQSGATSFVPQISIPGYTFNSSDNTTGNIANYVKAIYKYLIGIVGIVAAIMLMVGGVVWLTAGGSPEKVKQAQEYIVGSLTGLVLALGSFLILGTINPALVNFRVSSIKPVDNASINSSGIYNSGGTSGCCNYPDKQECGIATKDDCSKNNGAWAGENYSCSGKVCISNTNPQDKIIGACVCNGACTNITQKMVDSGYVCEVLTGCKCCKVYGVPCGQI